MSDPLMEARELLAQVREQRFNAAIDESGLPPAIAAAMRNLRACASGDVPAAVDELKRVLDADVAARVDETVGRVSADVQQEQAQRELRLAYPSMQTPAAPKLGYEYKWDSPAKGKPNKNGYSW